MERDKLVINNQYLVKLEDDDTATLTVCTLLALHGDFAIVKPDGEQPAQWVPVERVVRETVAGMPASPEAVPAVDPADVTPSEPVPAADSAEVTPFGPLTAQATEEAPDPMWRVDRLGWFACVGGEVRKVLGIDTAKGEALVATPVGPSTVALADLT